jgi:hypothetical protein
VFKSVAKGYRFEFDSDCIIDWNDSLSLEYKSQRVPRQLSEAKRTP